jgi:mono/diheme cytochrome c family protein
VTLRNAIIGLNIVAILVIASIIVFRVVSVRRNPETSKPSNLTPFAEDAGLEGPRLERVLRWALICSTVLAVGLPIYWLREPTRQKEELSGFDKRAEERGATLFSNSQMETYDPTKSLQCANCHGVKGEGGATSFTISAAQTGTGRPVQVQWRAPALNTVLSRFTPDQVTQIITYGRPNTPMAPWGIDGGGPKGVQAISDLVAYLQSIQLGNKGAHKQADDNVAKLKSDARDGVKSTQDALAAAQQKLDAATTPAEVAADQTAVTAQQQAVTNSQNWLNTVNAAGEGELLFDTNCARCHTRGWSFFDPTTPTVPLPDAPGAGAFGPKLNGGGTLNQFPGDVGIQQQIDWVTNRTTPQPDGSVLLAIGPNKGYGVRGISSGRMAHFGDILTGDQIKAIVIYERSL